MSVKVTAKTKEFRKGYDGIRWDAETEDIPMPKEIGVESPTKVYPSVGWVIPSCNYQGC
jgi:hypothetical protein